MKLPEPLLYKYEERDGVLYPVLANPEEWDKYLEELALLHDEGDDDWSYD